MVPHVGIQVTRWHEMMRYRVSHAGPWATWALFWLEPEISRHHVCLKRGVWPFHACIALGARSALQVRGFRPSVTLENKHAHQQLSCGKVFCLFFFADCGFHHGAVSRRLQWAGWACGPAAKTGADAFQTPEDIWRYHFWSTDRSRCFIFPRKNNC